MSVVRGELNDSELSVLRHRSAWWWAVWCTPICYLAWIATLIGATVLVVRPDSLLAHLVLTGLAGALAAAVAKAVAVETLLSRWLDRSRKDRTRSDIRELNRKQVYRATRHDAVLGIRAFVDGVIRNWI